MSANEFKLHDSSFNANLLLLYFPPALGEPLIKGLTEVANQRPENPIMFLANFLLKYANGGEAAAATAKTNPLENVNVNDTTNIHSQQS